MNIELYGAGFLNKGAQMMILAVMEAFRRRGISVRFAIDPREHADFDARAPLGIRQIYSLEPLWTRKKYQCNLRKLAILSEKWIPARLARRMDKQFGILRRCDCDALIDISGYRYGDHWGAIPIRMFASVAADYRKRGKPVILMPQMFGPFVSQDVQLAFSEALDSCTRVYARDPDSLEHLTDTFGKRAIYRKCSDITISLQPAEHPPRIDVASPLALIVPNVKVYENGKPVAGENYVAFLKTAFLELQNRGYAVRFLIHESQGKDEPVAMKVITMLGLQAQEYLLKSPDPLILKAWLGAASLVLASRFHAVVSALSQAVPTMVIGWAHKYECLMADFGNPQGMLKTNDIATEFCQRLDAIDADRASLHDTLHAKKKICTQEVEACWQDVFSILDGTTADK